MWVENYWLVIIAAGAVACFWVGYFNPFWIEIRKIDNASRVRFGSKADMCSAIGDVRFTPESGHVRCTKRMSALCQKRTSTPLFDHFVGAGEKRRRHVEAKRERRLSELVDVI